MIIIALLASMVVPLVGEMHRRAQRASCASNLRGLYIAASACLDSTGHWPQVSPGLIQSDSTEYARQWHVALQPYGIAPINWVCPTVQTGLGSPDLNKHENARVDYLATPFDPDPISPRKYLTQPWFTERGDVHGDGNLVVFANGSIKSLNEIFTDRH